MEVGISPLRITEDEIEARLNRENLEALRDLRRYVS